MEKILKALEPIFHAVFDDEGIVLKPEMSAADIEAWDSLTHIRLVVAIEKHFGIKFAFGELQDLKDVGEMATLIAEKVAEE